MSTTLLRIRLTRSVIVGLLAISAAVNWAWEMAHMDAYADMAALSWTSSAWRCLRASAGDAALTLLAAAAAVHLAPAPPRT